VPTPGECELVGDITLQADLTTPYLSLLGDSPLYIEEGQDYEDAGVETTSMALGTTTLTYFINDEEVDDVALDTGVQGTYRIAYVITGGNGYSGTTTRTVVIREKKTIVEVDQPVLIDTSVETPLPSTETGSTTESSGGGSVDPVAEVNPTPVDTPTDASTEPVDTPTDTTGGDVGSTTTTSESPSTSDAGTPSSAPSEASGSLDAGGAPSAGDAGSTSSSSSGSDGSAASSGGASTTSDANSGSSSESSGASSSNASSGDSGSGSTGGDGGGTSASSASE